MTIYEVMKDGHVLLAIHDRYEHLVSWDRNKTLFLWIETNGSFELLETRQFAVTLSTLDMAIAAATKMILNVEDQARTVLHEVQSLTMRRKWTQAAQLTLLRQRTWPRVAIPKL